MASYHFRVKTGKQEPQQITRATLPERENTVPVRNGLI